MIYLSRHLSRILSAKPSKAKQRKRNSDNNMAGVAHLLLSGLSGRGEG